MFICATDEHGTPAELAAAKAGKPVEDLLRRNARGAKADIGRGFRLSFDHFGRSSSAAQPPPDPAFRRAAGRQRPDREVSEKQVYSIDDNRFLPDRYIEGTCPNCGYDSARGDQCDNCTKQLDPTDLINPHSTISARRIWRCGKPSTCT
jgi:methionyl-tRNA synthetase